MNSKIIKYANDNDVIIAEDALRLLNIDNYKKIIDHLKKQNKIFIKSKDIENIKTENKKKYVKNFYILDKYNITEDKKYSQGSVEDFQKLFLDKYKTLSEIIKTRPNLEHKGISQAKREPKNKPVDVIGMVYDKRLSKNGNLVLTIDDPTGSIKLVIMNKDDKEFQTQKEILLDNVIGFKCNVLSKDMLIVNEIIYPDIPLNIRQNNLQEDVYLAVIGDIHVGSKNFREKEFSKFIDWINLKINNDIELAKKIKYLVIAGDVVDGIGVYPAQYDELVITDIYKQYELLEDYLLKIRDDIEVFIISGNHDAVRLSDPQPPISKDYLKRIYDKENFHILSSPSWVVIENYKVLMYHGASFHGIYAEIKNATMNKPDSAMKEVLIRRDLMPQYGQRQTFIPIEKNFLTINEVPDIFITGDVHHHAYSKYKNTHLLCASCWQTITAFQKEIGHIPTLSKVLLLNLKDEKLIIKDFLEDKD